MKWEEMDAKAQDAWIAEHVMGWTRTEECSDPDAPVVQGWCTGPGRFDFVATHRFSPSIDASADYLVLSNVRAEWGVKRTSEFSNCLVGDVWAARRSGLYRGLCYAGHVMYEPGDYSRAAFLALETSDEA